MFKDYKILQRLNQYKVLLLFHLSDNEGGKDDELIKKTWQEAGWPLGQEAVSTHLLSRRGKKFSIIPSNSKASELRHELTWWGRAGAAEQHPEQWLLSCTEPCPGQTCSRTMDIFAYRDIGDCPWVSPKQDKGGSMGPPISSLKTASLVSALITQAQTPGAFQWNMLVILTWKGWRIKRLKKLPWKRPGWSSGLDIRNRIKFYSTNSKFMHLRAGGNFYYIFFECLAYKEERHDHTSFWQNDLADQ